MTVIDAGVEQIGPHVAAEIAVRDDANQISLAAGDANAAKAFCRHLQHGSRHFGAKRSEWDRLAALHDVAGEFQQHAEPAARMEQSEIDRGETTAFQESDRQCVAKRQLHSGTTWSVPDCAGRPREPVEAAVPHPRTCRACFRHPRSCAVATRPMRKRREKSIRSLSSVVSPDHDSAMMTSSGVIMPRSPWLASPGCTKNAGVPVDAMVAAILRATWPDLPIPVTITRPLARRINSTAAMKDCPSPLRMAAVSALIPPASASRRAQRRIWDVRMALAWNLLASDS